MGDKNIDLMAYDPIYDNKETVKELEGKFDGLITGDKCKKMIQ